MLSSTASSQLLSSFSIAASLRARHQSTLHAYKKIHSVYIYKMHTATIAASISALALDTLKSRSQGMVEHSKCRSLWNGVYARALLSCSTYGSISLRCVTITPARGREVDRAIGTSHDVYNLSYYSYTPSDRHSTEIFSHLIRCVIYVCNIYLYVYVK